MGRRKVRYAYARRYFAAEQLRNRFPPDFHLVNMRRNWAAFEAVPQQQWFDPTYIGGDFDANPISK